MKKSVSPKSLNKDDNSLSLAPTESTFSLNIDSEGVKGGETGVVKHIKGNIPAQFSDESMAMPYGDNKIIGSVKDEQLNVVYFFVHNSNNQHCVVAFNSKKKTYRVVFRSSALEFESDSFVKADIVRLRRVPEDTEMIIETPPEPEAIFPVKLRFAFEIDASAIGEKAGYKAYDSADSLNLFSTARIRLEGTNIPFYQDENIPIGQGVNTTNSSAKIVDLRKSDHIVDGWVLVGSAELLVHPDSLENSSALIQYKIDSPLLGESDVFSSISFFQINAAADSDSTVVIPRRCFGFSNKDITELLVSDLYEGTQANLMSATTETGRLLDRKLKFVSSTDFSQVEEFQDIALQAVVEASGGPFVGGRSVPQERFDDEGPGEGFGDEDIDDDGLVVITYCPTGFGVGGAQFDSFQSALAALYDMQSQGIAATIQNVCPTGAPLIDFKPGVFIEDDLMGFSSFESSTPAVINPQTLEFPDTYETISEFYPSSCGTMRRKSRFVFNLGQAPTGNIFYREDLASSGDLVLGLNLSSLLGVSNSGVLATSSFSQITEDENLSTELTRGAREFELSVNIDGGNITSSIDSNDVVAKLQYPPEAGSGSLTVLDVCYNTNFSCAASSAGLPPPPDRIIDDVEGGEIVVPPPPVVTNEGSSSASSSGAVKDAPVRDAQPTSLGAGEAETTKAKTNKRKK